MPRPALLVPRHSTPVESATVEPSAPGFPGIARRLLALPADTIALWALAVLCVLTVALGGKPYYTTPLLVLLVAAGAEPAWRWVLRHRVWASAAAVAGALGSVLIALPVLPVGALGPVLAVNPEQGEQVGWRELTASVARAWAQAGPGAVIFTHNYGQAGAVERYGPEYGLPQPYSGHMSYADWGPPPDSASGRVVVVGPPPRSIHRLPRRRHA